MTSFKTIAFATAGAIMAFAPVSAAFAWGNYYRAPPSPQPYYPMSVWQSVTQQQQQQIVNNYGCGMSNASYSGTTCVYSSNNANIAVNVAAMNTQPKPYGYYYSSPQHPSWSW